jgi:hypothetical protein
MAFWKGGDPDRCPRAVLWADAMLLDAPKLAIVANKQCSDFIFFIIYDFKTANYGKIIFTETGMHSPTTWR